MFFLTTPAPAPACASCTTLHRFQLRNRGGPNHDDDGVAWASRLAARPQHPLQQLFRTRLTSEGGADLDCPCPKAEELFYLVAACVEGVFCTSCTWTWPAHTACSESARSFLSWICFRFMLETWEVLLCCWFCFMVVVRVELSSRLIGGPMRDCQRQ